MGAMITYHEKLAFSSTKPPPAISQIAPESPNKIPISWLTLTLVLNNNMANTKVKSGTNAFNIPMSELSNSVWALVNRKAGKPLPNKPTISIGIIFFFSIEKILFWARKR